ncbi:hypothetical protein [Streptomyces sp. NPDC049949]|uniref:hypothetical protein n=1 Tax=Streptomyces sp. NPDC049949 TaxID=3154627 RepID=UPI00342E64CE
MVLKLPVEPMLAQAAESVPGPAELWAQVTYEQKLWTGIGVCPLPGVRGGVAAAGGEDAVEVVAEYGDG